MVTGRVALWVGTIPLVQARRMKALGITTLRSSPLFPGLKPVAEQGVSDFQFAGSWSLYVPRGVPKPILDKLQAETERFLTGPAMRKQFFELSMEVAPPHDPRPARGFRAAGAQALG